MKFLEPLEEIYSIYLKKSPLNINVETEKEIYLEWKEKYRLSILKFSQIICFIDKTNSLDKFNCDYDYDNIYPIIAILYDEKWISFNESNQLIKNFPITIDDFPIKSIKPIYNTPNAEYNQFPCSLQSRKKRVNKLIHDFPYIKDLKIAFLGDDDLTSLELSERSVFNITVYEKDLKIIELIKKFDLKSKIKLICEDVKEKPKTNNLYDVVFFDPPYNINGFFTFLKYSEAILKNNGYLYVSINQMMLGNKGMSNILNIITSMNFFIIEMIPSFSIYPFPQKYREYQDLKKEMTYLDINNINSSASTLIILKKHQDISTNLISTNIYSRYKS
jgi:predicted methyltransferase